MKYVLSLFLLLFLFPVSAHLEAGEDIQVNGYTIDFGYAPAAPHPGESTILSLTLIDGAKAVEEPVWIRISDKDTVLFAGTLAAGTPATVIFPHSGTYELATLWKEKETILAEHTFTIDVPGVNNWFILFSLLLIGAGAYLLSRKFG